MRTLLLALCLVAAYPAISQDDYTLLGAGVRSRPNYDGSSSRTVDLIPVVRYYGKPWFARSTQGVLEGGARVTLGGGFVAGAQLAYEQGPFDKDPGASAGVHLEWDGKLGPMPVSLMGRHRQYLDSDHGMQFDLRANAAVYQSGPALLGLFTQFTFANAENTRAYFGVSESGHQFTDLGAWGSYDLTREWILLSNVHVRRLTVAGVQKSTGTYASVGVAYKF